MVLDIHKLALDFASSNSRAQYETHPLQEDGDLRMLTLFLLSS